MKISRTRRIFSLLLTLLMLAQTTSFLLVPLSAEETAGEEIAISHYFSNSGGDWETWGGNTNLVLTFNGVNAGALENGIRGDLYDYYFTIGGTRFHINPASCYPFGGNSILLRFPTITDGFYPMKDVAYSAFVEIYTEGERVYYGGIDDLVSRITDNVVAGATRLQTSSYGSGMENLRSTDATGGYATQILFTVKSDGLGLNLRELYNNKDRYIWTLHVANAEGCVNVTALPHSAYCFSDTNAIFRFEPCIADTPLFPEQNKTYYIALTVRAQDGKVVYYADSHADGYKLEEDPVIPDTVRHTVNWVIDGVTYQSSCVTGQVPVCPFPTAKAADAAYSYTFTGWLPAPAAVRAADGDLTYTAVYERSVNEYPITWVIDGKETVVYAAYGTTPVCPVTPAKPADGDAGILYRFEGWSPGILAVTGAARYEAVFTPISIGDHLRFTVEEAAGHIGEDLSVSVKVRGADADKIGGYSFLLCYDAAKIELLDKSVPLSHGYGAVKTVEPGKLRFQWTDIDTPLADGDTVATLTLRMQAGAVAPALEMTAEDGTDGVYTVNAAAHTLPDLDCYYIGGALRVVPYIVGDISGDALVNIQDITALLAVLAGVFDRYTPGSTDVNGDGLVSIMDVSRLLHYLAEPATKIYASYAPLTHTVRYTAGHGGKIVGEKTQDVVMNAAAKTVTAEPLSSIYRFAYWSDGELSATRNDIITSETAVEAVFERIPMELDIASIHIETEGSREIVSKTEYLQMTLSVSGSTTPAYNIEGYTGGIRGRGNSSWDYFQRTKPSYRIKFDTKHQLLGVGAGADRDWILLTTYSDLSMLRNPAAWEMGKMFDGVSFTTSYSFVHVYLNGEYRGVYILCDQVESGNARIDINDELPELDKGYLIEMDARAGSEGTEGIDWFQIKGGQQPFVIKSEVSTKEECDFAKGLVQNLHDALMSGDRARIEKVCYLDSLVDMYIIEEMTKDRDVGFASFYFYRDAGDKFRFGAPWDFDLGLGNDSAYPYTNGLVSVSGNGNHWFETLIGKSWFRTLVRERLTEVEPYMEVLSETLYAYGSALSGAAAMNYDRWKVMGTNTFLSPREVARLDSFDAHVEYLVNWIEDRFDWLEGEFAN